MENSQWFLQYNWPKHSETWSRQHLLLHSIANCPHPTPPSDLVSSLNLAHSPSSSSNFSFPGKVTTIFTSPRSPPAKNARKLPKTLWSPTNKPRLCLKSYPPPTNFVSKSPSASPNSIMKSGTLQRRRVSWLRRRLNAPSPIGTRWTWRVSRRSTCACNYSDALWSSGRLQMLRRTHPQVGAFVYICVLFVCLCVCVCVFVCVCVHLCVFLYMCVFFVCLWLLSGRTQRSFKERVVKPIQVCFESVQCWMKTRDKGKNGKSRTSSWRCSDRWTLLPTIGAKARVNAPLGRRPLGAPQTIIRCHAGHCKGLSRFRLVGSCVLPGEDFFT